MVSDWKTEILMGTFFFSNSFEMPKFLYLILYTAFLNFTFVSKNYITVLIIKKYSKDMLGRFEPPPFSVK